jgi:hypothetical protein
LLEDSQLARVEPDKPAADAGVDDRVPAGTIGVHVHPSPAPGAMRYAAKLGRVDRLDRAVADRVDLAPPGDDRAEVITSEQDAATVRAIADGVAVEDGRGQPALAARAVKRVVAVERDNPLPDRLREVERLAIRATQM